MTSHQHEEQSSRACSASAIWPKARINCRHLGREPAASSAIRRRNSLRLLPYLSPNPLLTRNRFPSYRVGLLKQPRDIVSRVHLYGYKNGIIALLLTGSLCAAVAVKPANPPLISVPRKEEPLASQIVRRTACPEQSLNTVG